MIHKIEETRLEMKEVMEFISNMPENKKLNVISAKFNGDNNVIYHEKLNPENTVIVIEQFNRELTELETAIQDCEEYLDHASLLILKDGDVLLEINTEYIG
jgi:hypothetical protein